MVGDAPVACIRTQIAWPGVWVSPVTSASAPIAVSVLPTTRLNATKTVPFAAMRTMARYSPVPTWRATT